MFLKDKFFRFLSLTAAVSLCLNLTLTAAAAPASNPIEDRLAAQRAMPIQSNEIDGWPQGPVVNAESAILMEAETGTILYSKNIHQKQFPASTTKILTALLTYENCGMDEIVTFSHDDVFGIPRNSNHIAMDEGDTLDVETCLNALLIRSANEVAYALAEHVGGSWENFADMMNQRAKELGAVDSNFVNPNGLPDEEHVTSAYDLAMIGRAFFSIETLCKITLTPKLVVPKEKEDLIEWNQMGLIPTGKYAYENIVGCKTGYTDSARSTLVSCAEKNGMRLICVVLHDESPAQYEDTVSLFEYGFSNFEKVNVSQVETKYDIDNIGFFYNDTDIFGSGGPILALNKEDCVILPKTISFQELESTISYETENPGQAAVITYTCHNVPVGSVSIDLIAHSPASYTFEKEENPEMAETTPSPSQEDTDPQKEDSTPRFVFISPLLVKIILVLILVGAVLTVIWLFLRRNFQFSLGSGLRRSRNRGIRQQELLLNRERQRNHRAQIRAAKRRARARYKRRR